MNRIENVNSKETDFQCYRVNVDYDQSVEQLAQAGKYAWVIDYMTSRNFRSREKGKTQLDIFLVGFAANIEIKDAVRQMDKLGLRPATLKVILALGAAHPELQLQNPIVAVGSTWRDPDHHLSVPCLYGDRIRGRYLDLDYCEGDWNPRWRFAAVRKN